MPDTLFPLDNEAAQKAFFAAINAHAPSQAAWDNLGGGWRIECLCGRLTEACKTMEAVGWQFDEHLRESGIKV